MSAPRPQKGLTYGRLLLILTGLIGLAVALAWWRQANLSQPAFEDIPWSRVSSARYVETRVDSAQLARLQRTTPKVPGAVLFVRTNAQNYAVLAAEFTFCLLDPQNVKFWIHRGTVYAPDGQVVRRLDNACVDLSTRFDLDGGAAEGQGAPEGSADLYFVQRGPAQQELRALPGTFLALPTASQLRPD